MRAPVTNRPKQPAPALRWTAVFCALTVLALGLLAVSPQLHASLHCDAHHQDHACAVTFFSQGVEAVPGIMASVSAPESFVVGSCLGQPVTPVAEVQLRLPPGCGPPLC